MANSIERRGVHHCGEIAERYHWLFREQPVDDIGIDAHMELTDNSGKCLQLFALQIKSGESWFREKRDGSVIFRGITERQYNYWITNSLPCIVVLYNPDDEICIWQKLTADTIKRTCNGTGKGFYVEVPLSQVFLNDFSNEQLCAFTKLPERVINYNFLLSQKKFMEIIQDGGVVKLHSEEWINKSIGRGDIELIIVDGENETKYSYPYWFPLTPYPKVFSRLFPWAEFCADEDFYEDYDTNLWHEDSCCYDKEDDKWIVCGNSFKEFRESLDPMRSIDIAGEVAENMLILQLNELGKAFLKVEQFISQNQAYVNTRPKLS